MPLAEGLLVHPKVADHLRLSPLQSSPNRTIHDRMHLVPRQPQSLRHRLLTGCQQPVDRQPLEQGRKAAVRLCPRNRRQPNSVLGTISPRHLGMQDRAILTGIQVPPTPLRLVIVQRTGSATLRARPRRRCRVCQIHMHLAFPQFQLYAIHTPRRSNSQNLLVQLTVLHDALPLPEKASSYRLDGSQPTCYARSRSVKQRRALLGSNPTRDSRTRAGEWPVAPWRFLPSGPFSSSPHSFALPCLRKSIPPIISHLHPLKSQNSHSTY